MRSIVPWRVGCGLACVLMTSAWSQTLPQPNTTTLQVQTSPGAADLTCPTLAKKKKTPSVITESPDPWVIPDEEVVAIVQQESSGTDTALAAPPNALPPGWLKAQPAGQPFRMAVWGDSHMAAGFFTRELLRALGPVGETAHGRLIPPTMNRAGVRLGVRKTCVSSGWRHESAHAQTDAAQFPGPALVNLFSSTAQSSLAWDLRDRQGLAVERQVTLLFQQTPEPIRVHLSVDAQAGQEVVLAGPPGPARLVLKGDAPLSVLNLRLVQGDLRVHGLELDSAVATQFQFDLFAYPGATVGAWSQADLSYLKTWFTGHDVQLVVLAYGTNEGNRKPFVASAYQEMLEQAVRNMRQIFPAAACLLVGPGDRGVLIPRSVAQNIKNKSRAKGKHKPQATPTRTVPAQSGVDLLAYTRIHQQIVAIQKQVAVSQGCQAWSMFDAMGGEHSAYAWARKQPALMAPDLIHFSIKGYAQLGQDLVQDMKWGPDLLWSDRP